MKYVFNIMVFVWTITINNGIMPAFTRHTNVDLFIGLAKNKTT